MLKAVVISVSDGRHVQSLSGEELKHSGKSKFLKVHGAARDPFRLGKACCDVGRLLGTEEGR